VHATRASIGAPLQPTTRGLAVAIAPAHVHLRRLPIAHPLLPALAPSRANLPSFFHRHRQNHLLGPAQAPIRLDPPRHPPLHRLRWIRRCRSFPGRIHVVVAFSARSAVPFAGSVAVVAFPIESVVPLLFCPGHGHHDRRRCVHCRRPPWRGTLTFGRSKKQEGQPAGALLLCRPVDR
jgi:hypothetical protein